jgi:hypothetical protein
VPMTMNLLTVTVQTTGMLEDEAGRQTGSLLEVAVDRDVQNASMIMVETFIFFLFFVFHAQAPAITGCVQLWKTWKTWKSQGIHKFWKSQGKLREFNIYSGKSIICSFRDTI